MITYKTERNLHSLYKVHIIPVFTSDYPLITLAVMGN